MVHILQFLCESTIPPGDRNGALDPLWRRRKKAQGGNEMKKSWLLSVVVFAFVLARVCTAGAAQWANPGLIVSPDQVEQNIDKPDWVVVDCRELQKYAEGHIPGAISMGDRCKKVLRDPTARVYPDISIYEKLFGKLGIGNNTHVVFYYGDEKDIDDATVGFWIIEYLGHDKAHVLNGGIDAWRKSGKRLDNKPVQRQPAAFKAKKVSGILATTAEMLKIAEGKTKGVQVIDARTEKENRGQDIRAIRGGHIPHTTINVDHLSTLDKIDDPQTGKKKVNPYFSPDNVAKSYESLNKNTRTIAYCQTGTRSTLTYFELRLLGFTSAANYDDSWTVWANSIKDYPVEDEQYIDLARIKKLEDDLKKLQEKLKQADEKK